MVKATKIKLSDGTIIDLGGGNIGGSSSVLDLMPYITGLDSISLEGYNLLKKGIEDKTISFITLTLADYNYFAVITQFNLTNGDIVTEVFSETKANVPNDLNISEYIFHSTGKFESRVIKLPSIEANPTSQTATEELKTIQIGATTYSISSASTGGLVLGETSGTAYDGSKGKANADNIKTLQTSVGNLENTKQDKLISATNIKTINGETILGNGNIEISGGSIPTASATTLGGVKVGNGLKIDTQGTLSIDVATTSEIDALFN